MVCFGLYVYFLISNWIRGGVFFDWLRLGYKFNLFYGLGLVLFKLIELRVGESCFFEEK